MSSRPRFRLDEHPILAILICLIVLGVVIAGIWLLLGWLIWLLAQPLLMLLYLFTLI